MNSLLHGLRLEGLVSAEETGTAAKRSRRPGNRNRAQRSSFSPSRPPRSATRPRFMNDERDTTDGGW